MGLTIFSSRKNRNTSDHVILRSFDWIKLRESIALSAPNLTQGKVNRRGLFTPQWNQVIIGRQKQVDTILSYGKQFWKQRIENSELYSHRQLQHKVGCKVNAQ